MKNNHYNAFFLIDDCNQRKRIRNGNNMYDFQKNLVCNVLKT